MTSLNVRANDGVRYIVANVLSVARGRAVLIVASSEFVSTSSKRRSFEFNLYGRMVNKYKCFTIVRNKNVGIRAWPLTVTSKGQTKTRPFNDR